MKSASAFAGIWFLLLWVFVSIQLQKTVRYYHAGRSESAISMREFPYPFRAALSISSDIDSTDSLREFLLIQEFLSTTDQTPLGRGVGLEIGNSFFPVDDRGRFSLLSENPSDAEVILDLIRLGYIDVIHSFNSAASRSEIEGIIEVLSRNNCMIDVWANHSDVPSNLGPDDSALGDNRDSDIYHSDISTRKLGCKFVWLDDVSSMVGQGRALHFTSFFDAFDREHPLQSLYNNVLKELIKYILAVFGNDAFGLRKYNELISPIDLDDGTKVFEFVRSNFFYAGSWDRAATSDALADVLRKGILQKLIDVEGYSIIYTHLGKNGGYPFMSEQTRNAFKRLEKEYKSGNIYITTTSRLLSYYANKKYLSWHCEKRNDETYIILDYIEDPVRGKFVPSVNDLRGLTFYSHNPQNTHIIIDDKETSEIEINGPDYTNRKSIMIQLQPLRGLDKKMKKYKKKGFY